MKQASPKMMFFTSRASLSVALLSAALAFPCASCANNLNKLLATNHTDGQRIQLQDAIYSTEFQFSIDSSDINNIDKEYTAGNEQALFKSLNSKTQNPISEIQDRYLTIRTGKKEKIQAVYDHGVYGVAYVQNW